MIYLRKDIKNCSDTQLGIYIDGLNLDCLYEEFKFRLNKGEWVYTNEPNYIFYNLKNETVYQADAEYKLNNEWISIDSRAFITQSINSSTIKPQIRHSGGININRRC